MAAAGGGELQEMAERAEGAEQLVFACHCPARCTLRTKYPACDAEIPSALDGFYSVLTFTVSVGDAPRVKLTFFSGAGYF